MSNPQHSNSINQNYFPQDIEHVNQTTYVITHQVQTSGQPLMRSLNQVEQLQLIIRQMEQERNHIVESEVLKALKAQEEQFNIFYQENIRKVELHFQNQIIPQKIKAIQNEFYKHQSLSALTQVTSSSTTLIPTETTSTPRDLDQEAYLNEKHEEWKATYLPVILELKEKEWLQRYESVELEKILSQKYQEWENINLLSIMKEQRNKWILQQLFAERTEQLNKYHEQTLSTKIYELQQYWQQVLTERISSQLSQWNSNQQSLIKARIHEVEQYWEDVILPQRISQWSQEHGSNLASIEKVNSATVSYTSADLDRILAEEHRKWQSQAEIQVRNQLQSQRKNWQLDLLPRIKLEWQKQYTSTHQTTTSLETSTIDQIINTKYEEWNHTYLPEYLRLQKIKWLEQYITNELAVAIRKKQEEWQSLRLLQIVRQPRNNWVIEAILKQRIPEIQNSIIIQQRNKWQNIIQQNNNQWEFKLSVHRKEWQSEWENQRNNWLADILIEKKNEWQRQYALTHPRQQQIIVKEVIKETGLQSQISNHEQLWRSEQQITVQNRIQEVERYWSGILQQQRLSFQKALESALQLRTTEIQTYWQQVMVPQIKAQWQVEQVQLMQNQPTAESQEQKVTQRVDTILQRQVEKRMQEWLRVEVPLIVSQKQQEWQVNWTQTQQFRTSLLQQQQEWTRSMEINHQHQLNEQRVYFESQIETIRSQSALLISQLEKNLQLKQTQYRSLQARLVAVQRSSIQNREVSESLNTKQAIEQVRIEHQNVVHQLKLSYEEKLSEINHQKSLLLIQLKQLQISIKNGQTSTRPKQSMNMNLIQANFDKQVLSLQATIKTKESQTNFLKKSLDSLTLENQQLNSRIINLNAKLANLQTLLDQTRNNSIKLDYQIKYLKEKQTSFSKKMQTKDFQFNQLKSRLEFQKSLLQKKLRQHSSSAQTLSLLQLKINQYESQLSLKHSSLKNLQNQMDRKKRQLEEQKQRSGSYLREIQVQKSTIKQYESVIQDLRLQIRKSCDEINRDKLIIESWQQKQRSYIEQIRKMESKGKSQSQSQQLIRQNERLKLQINKLRQKLIHHQSNQSIQIYRLKQTILSLQTRMKSTSMNFREGDITEIQILKRINHQISDLVSTNKQLQIRIIVLENQKQLSAFGISIQRFFVAFQQQMDHLINYFINSQIFSSDSIKSYNKFQHKSRQTLTNGYVQDYFRQWQALMRGLIEQNYQRTVNLFKLASGSSANAVKEEQIDQIVDKYDAVLNDVKFTLLEFIKTGNEEYIQLMSKSLGLEFEENQSLKQNRVLKQ